jgi:hypothetical protein
MPTGAGRIRFIAATSTRRMGAISSRACFAHESTQAPHASNHFDESSAEIFSSTVKHLILDKVGSAALRSIIF